MKNEEIRTGAIPNCQCHQRIAQLESALETVSNYVACYDCPEVTCRQVSGTAKDHIKCTQCWIDWAMEEAKK